MSARPVVVLAGSMYHPAGERLLERHATLRRVASPSADAMRAACAGAHAIAARYPHRVDDALLRSADALVVVACSGRGTDAVDVQAATERGVAVVYNPGFGRRPVSESAIALILALAKRIVPSDAWMRRGEGWAHRSDFREFVELEGKTLGIVGLGDVGRETARKAIAAFGMRVLAYDPYVSEARMREAHVVRCDTLDALLEAADVVSVHAELNDETRGMIGEPQLRRMQGHALLVNTARGRIVQQAALVRALRERWIAGAALDVYEDEPAGAGNPLYELDNIVLTPHVAGLSIEAVEGMSRSSARQIVQALTGTRPAHLVNPEAWARAHERARRHGFTLDGALE